MQRKNKINRFENFQNKEKFDQTINKFINQSKY